MGRGVVVDGIKFSVITVCLNPGEKLYETLDSVLRQSYRNVEVILKDGGSKDGSVTKWQKEHEADPDAGEVRIFVENDTGIYDAMNQ
ncbi:MAG TPA: glycosyltransferase, partial [Lachnospiraceae bacterium]|nr:glycosyltransferase [Lachnospiraceae bacterium]